MIRHVCLHLQPKYSELQFPGIAGAITEFLYLFISNDHPRDFISAQTV